MSLILAFGLILGYSSDPLRVVRLDHSCRQERSSNAKMADFRIEILYRTSASEADRRRVRKKLCAQSVKNLGDPNQELVVVSIPESEQIEKTLNIAKKDPAVIQALCTSKIRAK